MISRTEILPHAVAEERIWAAEAGPHAKIVLLALSWAQSAGEPASLAKVAERTELPVARVGELVGWLSRAGLLNRCLGYGWRPAV